jgi:DNA-binding response OmpR family regulator
MEKVVGKVLLLEDEAIIAIDLEETLRNLGASRIVTMDTCEAALSWLKENDPTLAIVDPRLKDGYCGPVARRLSEKGVPFIVYSGDPEGAGMEDDSFKRGIWLSKPSLPEDLEEAIERA